MSTKHPWTCLNLLIFSYSVGTHLSSQNYDICVRRAAGQCAICWNAATAGTTTAGATAVRGSFGLG